MTLQSLFSRALFGLLSLGLLTAQAQPLAAATRATTVPADGRAVDASVVLDWAEVRLPSLFTSAVPTLSRSRPGNIALDYQGLAYTVRAYPQARYLAVGSDGSILGLGDFTGGVLQNFGPVAGLAPLILSESRLQSVGVMVTSPIAPDEQFRFALGSQSALVSRQGEILALATLPSATLYNLTQTEGPRTCTPSGNRSGSVGFRDVVVAMDCGLPIASSLLSGTVHAPVGSVVGLQASGNPDISVAIAPVGASTDVYDLQRFNFPVGLPSSSVYQVAVGSTAAGQTCSVYKGASGSAPVALNSLRVGCEWRSDLLSRSTDYTTRGTYYDSRDLSLGGAATPVETTLEAYGEARFAAYVSSAKLGGSSGAHRQVFWRDRLTGETRMISTSASGLEGNGDSFAPVVSTDGLTVAFESYASNLVDADTNGVTDVFVWSAMNSQRGAERVSVGANGVQGNSGSNAPTLSGDGRYVAFSTSASNLTAGVSSNSTVNVVLRDRMAATNRLISADAAGQGVGGQQAMLSQDGSRLAFYAYSSKLVSGDVNGLWDIFVFELPTGTLRRVSLTANGGERNQGQESASRVVAPTLSGNGRYVAFATTATNMDGVDTKGLQNVYVADLNNGVVQRASALAGALAGNGNSPVGQGERVALSYDGQWIAFTTAATNLGVAAGEVVLRNLFTGETRGVGASGGSSAFVVLSRDATYVGLATSQSLDARFSGSGLFAQFTGIGRAWWWTD